VLLPALWELNIEYRAAGKQTHSEPKLGNVVLAAADLDMEVISSAQEPRACSWSPNARRSTSPGRTGRSASPTCSSAASVGQMNYVDLPPQGRALLAAVPQIQIIDARIHAGFIGHDYFFSNPATSSDLILLLRDNLSAGAEHGRPLTKRQENYWEIDDKYPQNLER